MFNPRDLRWARFINFWTALLRMGLTDKDDCVYVMERVPELQAEAWMKLCECEPPATKDELIYLLEWIKDEDIRIRVFDKLMELSPSREDFLYVIKWTPDLRLLAGFAWIQTGISTTDLVYVFENVPEIQPRLSAKTLKHIILAADDPVTKAHAGLLLLKQDFNNPDTLLFITKQVPELQSAVAPFAQKILAQRDSDDDDDGGPKKKRPIGFVEPQRVKKPDKKKQPVGFTKPSAVPKK